MLSVGMYAQKVWAKKQEDCTLLRKHGRKEKQEDQSTVVRSYMFHV